MASCHALNAQSVSINPEELPAGVTQSLPFVVATEADV